MKNKTDRREELAWALRLYLRRRGFPKTIKQVRTWVLSKTAVEIRALRRYPPVWHILNQRRRQDYGIEGLFEKLGK
jgi:hypothetical protein